MQTYYLENHKPIFTFNNRLKELESLSDLDEIYFKTYLPIDNSIYRDKFFLKLFTSIKQYNELHPHRLINNSIKIIRDVESNYDFAFENCMEQYSLHFDAELAHIYNIGKVMDKLREATISSGEFGKLLRIIEVQINGYDSLTDITQTSVLSNVYSDCLEFVDKESAKTYYLNFENKTLKERIVVRNASSRVQDNDLVTVP